MAQDNLNPAEDFLAEISTKLRDIEEKQNIIKDRVLLIGENLVSEKEEKETEISALKSGLLSIEEEIKRLKLVLQRLIDENSSFVRRNEFDILKRQFEMFQPMNIARIRDVEDIVNRALKSKTNKI